MQGETVTKPNIAICLFEHEQSKQKIREIQAGIEEEGVPCILIPGEKNDAVALAWQAAGLSHLGVGVGVSQAAICLHYYKLSEFDPLFISEQSDNPTTWRLFGYNAARLVKGLPFKEDIPDKGLEADDQLYEQVRQIVMKILRETKQDGRRVAHV